MPKAGSADDNVFATTTTKARTGRQDDGTWLKSDGTVLPAREPRRVPYDEPKEKQVAGNEEVVEHPSGSPAFLAIRMDDQRFASVAEFKERKRLQCRYEVVETYAGQPRAFYSYDEILQIRKGELQK